ncbi:MAG: endonuclease VII domain-containing protein, partial [Acidimicrobiales bacterium]
MSDRRSYLKRTYGITPEVYDELLARQEGVCAICRRQPTPGISLHVDHDHDSGRIRGLLCFRCNNALGDFDDDHDRLYAALRYLGPVEKDEATSPTRRAPSPAGVSNRWRAGSDRPAGPGVTRGDFRFTLRLQGLTPAIEADGSVAYRDESGTVRATTPPGYMEDQALARSQGVAYR